MKTFFFSLVFTKIGGTKSAPHSVKTFFLFFLEIAPEAIAPQIFACPPKYSVPATCLMQIVCFRLSYRITITILLKQKKSGLTKPNKVLDETSCAEYTLKSLKLQATKSPVSPKKMLIQIELYLNKNSSTWGAVFRRNRRCFSF